MEQPIAWIAGGSRGIGLACAARLGREGYRIAISSRSASHSESAASDLREQGSFAIAVPCDVTREESVRHAYSTIREFFGAVPDVLVNSAGISPWSTFSETSILEFDNVIATNTMGMFLTSRAVLGEMYARGSGAIVQMLSVASLKGFRNGAAYVASKHASLGFTNALREEARAHGIRVISIFPGATETELWDEEHRAKFHDRMMQPEDIAEAVVAALRLPTRALIEEIVLRPIGGDL
ncbi:MAG TPA: SDR family oxidoreductase [Candidatus Kapabacteria bacterium]|jgi:NAD(P)-dependent dehydrogenase (short-subunit alcohol dehydrogenase family)